MRVLIVDDEVAIREALSMFIQDEGYQTLEAADGEEGVAAARASADPLVVLLDFLMPRLNGVEVLHIAAHDPTLARHGYILLSARSPYESQKVLAAHPSLRVTALMKPFDLNELSATVAMMAAAIAPHSPPLPGIAQDVPPPGNG